jgi:methylthioribulose-1-phosphate dehydratase
MTHATDPRAELIRAATLFYGRGWMHGTSGNLSARSDADDLGSFWITASGKAKGDLAPADFVRVDLDLGEIERGSPTSKPSAETSIHAAIYRRFPEAAFCFHVHTVNANLVARMTTGDAVNLPPLEMLKGLGLWVENPHAPLPILPNLFDVPKIAADAAERFAAAPPVVPGFLIRDHGLTCWGASGQEAINRVELFEYVVRYMVDARRAGIDTV